MLQNVRNKQKLHFKMSSLVTVLAFTQPAIVF